MITLFSTDRRDDGSKADDTATIIGTEPEEPPPSTYSMKEKFTYFKPRVEIETEEEGNKSFIRDIYVRGTVGTTLLLSCRG